MSKLKIKTLKAIFGVFLVNNNNKIWSFASLFKIGLSHKLRSINKSHNKDTRNKIWKEIHVFFNIWKKLEKQVTFLI